ncbi:hypothetical protein [Microbacterium testaceum]|uniref:hypothetical protein n=1 Tax=Microbacterium testaceum TaxID=2033 RepID=UPI003819DE23
MDATELMGKLKERLQEQQAEIPEGERGSALRHQRAELDTLWACVEVLAQLIDGDRNVIVPDYHADKGLKVRSRVRLQVPRENPSL